MTSVVGGYAIEGELGRGGTSAVFRARAPDGRLVALKLFLGGSEQLRRRFRREAELAARLDHDHLVRMLGRGEHAGRPYLVMELVEGEPLSQVLARRGPLPGREAAEITLAVARGVAHAHTRGVLHRDIKPANVVLEPTGRPRLVDFGLAKDEHLERSRLSLTGELQGTPHYWAPEQARGERSAVGVHTDVWGLGALLFALLADAPP